MKAFIVFLLALTSASAFAENYHVKGAEARSAMESLAASGLAVNGLDEEWTSARPLTINTGPILCHYSAATYPDEWRSSTSCYLGRTQQGEVLANSLSLARTIESYAAKDAGLGNR